MYNIHLFNKDYSNKYSAKYIISDSINWTFFSTTDTIFDMLFSVIDDGDEIGDLIATWDGITPISEVLPELFI